MVSCEVGVGVGVGVKRNADEGEVVTRADGDLVKRARYGGVARKLQGLVSDRQAV